MSTNKRPIVVGLDIGTTKVVAIAGRKNQYDKLEILGLGKSESEGVEHGVVLNIDQCIRSIERAVEDCLNSNPELQITDIRDVFVGIAGQHIKSLQTSGDRVRSSSDDEDAVITKEDIALLIKDQRKAILPAGDQIIEIIPQDFTVDNTPNVRQPIGMSGVKIRANFHVVTGDKNAIRNMKRCVERANLSVKEIILQPLASAAAVMTPEDMEAGVAIVDIGGGTTDMAVFHDNILHHTAVIPMAGNNITNDIRRLLGVLKIQAEAMKVKFGSALSSEANANAFVTIPGLKGLPPKEISLMMLAGVIQDKVENILEYVMVQLKQCKVADKLHGGIILTGGGSMLNDILQLAQLKTGMNVRIGKANEYLSGKYSEDLAHPMYATCIGLILRGYAQVEEDLGVNFFTVPQKDEENKTEQVPVNNFVQTEIEDEFIDEEPQPKKHKGDASNKRQIMINRVFTSIKTSILKLFGDEEDTKL